MKAARSLRSRPLARAWRHLLLKMLLVAPLSLASTRAHAVPPAWEEDVWAERWAHDSGQGPALSLRARVMDTPVGREGLASLTLTWPWGAGRPGAPSPGSSWHEGVELEHVTEPAQNGRRRRSMKGPSEDGAERGDEKRFEPDSPEEATPPAPGAADATDPSQSSVKGSDPAPRPIVVRSVLSPELVSETVAVALSLSRQGATRRRLAGLRARARSSALLPELRLRGGRSVDEALRLAPTIDDPDRYTQSGAAELFFDAQLTWRLHRLLFADEELRIEGLRERAAAARADLVNRVVAQLIAWERARLARDDPALSGPRRVAAALDQLEAEIVLDVLTEGWFGRRVRATSVRR